jgi:uncharacterized damage-inducible protein DinB
VRHSLLFALPFAALLLMSARGFADSHAGFKADLLGQIEYVQKQIMSLQEAVPQEKYGWRPAEGIRSVGEVYNHIAFGNYGLLSFAGYAPPQGIEISIEKAAEWDKGVTDKKGIAARLTASFEHVKAAIKNISDEELEKEINFFGNTVTIRNHLLTVLSHLHEHLGQSIAYARMNGVAPPWTAEREKEMKKEKGKY